jgi:3-dehydroquinate dehydratase
MAKKNGKKDPGKDPRFKLVNIMIKHGGIKSFKEIFDQIPKSVVAKALHMNNNRMTRLIVNPGGFTFEDIAMIAKLIGVDFMVLAGMIAKEKLV